MDRECCHSLIVLQLRVPVFDVDETAIGRRIDVAVQEGLGVAIGEHDDAFCMLASHTQGKPVEYAGWRHFQGLEGARRRRPGSRAALRIRGDT